MGSSGLGIGTQNTNSGGLFGGGQNMGRGGTNNPSTTATGTRQTSYQETAVQEANGTQVKLVAISAMPQFQGKSLEMLRLEDYVSVNKAGKAKVQNSGSSASVPNQFNGAQSTGVQGQNLQGPAMNNNLFGSSTNGGLFNAPSSSGPMPASSGMFGTPSSSGLFGAPTSGGLFGATATSGTFGTPASSAPFGAPANGGAFGAPTSSSMFGAPAPTTGGLFGSNSNTQGGFGSGGSFTNTATMQPAMAKPSGNAFPSSSTQSNGGLFGQRQPNKPQGLFSGQPNASNNTSLFGNTSTATQNSVPFPSGNTMFAPHNTMVAGMTTVSGIGNGPNNSLFSSSAQSSVPLAGNNNGNSLFGNSQQSTLQQTQRPNLIGSNSNTVSSGAPAYGMHQSHRLQGDVRKATADISGNSFDPSVPTFTTYAPPSPTLVVTPRIKSRGKPRGFRSRSQQSSNREIESRTSHFGREESDIKRSSTTRGIGDAARDSRSRSNSRFDLDFHDHIEYPDSPERSPSVDHHSYSKLSSRGVTGALIDAIDEATENLCLDDMSPEPLSNLGYIRVKCKVPAYSFFTTGAPVSAPREGDIPALVDALTISPATVQNMKETESRSDVRRSPITLWCTVRKRQCIKELKEDIAKRWEKRYEELCQQFSSGENHDRPAMNDKNIILVVNHVVISDRHDEDLLSDYDIRDGSSLLVTFAATTREAKSDHKSESPNPDAHADSSSASTVSESSARPSTERKPERRDQRRRSDYRPKPPRRDKGYYTENPTIGEMKKLSEEDLSCVKDFTVGREGYGKIKFLGITDIRGLDLEKLITIEQSEIGVYDNVPEEERPPIGEELNKPSELTLENEWPENGRDASRLEKEKYEEVLREFCENDPVMQVAKHIAYDGDRGTWTFYVEHF